VKRYFKLGANNKKLLAHLFISSALRNSWYLIIPFIASEIVEYAQNGDFNAAIGWSVAFLIAGIIYLLLWHYNFVAYKNNSIFIHNKLQQLVFNKVTTYDENFSKELSTPFIVNTGFNDVGKVHQVPDQAFDIITALISIIASIIILIVVNPLMGVAALILVLISFKFVERNLKNRELYLAGQRRHQDSISGLMGQIIDGNKEIKSFNMDSDLGNYLENYKKDWRKDYFLKRKYSDRAYVLSPAILGIGRIVLYFITIPLVLSGRYDIAVLVLVLGYYQDIEYQFERVFNKLGEISSNTTHIERIEKVLNYRTANMLDFGENNDDTIAGKIEFKNVSFTYEEQEVMKDVSFKIEPNSFTVIAGKSGSGKSTIFRLLLRLYKANKGEILLDNTDIYDYTKEVYPSNVSIVTQKPFIFDMSIRENLNLVDSNFENQVAACKRAGIHDFIMNLPDGYNTKLLRDAENLSAGQKQLLALARTLLSKSEVLLFDEVTSSLDMDASKRIINIMKGLKKDHTILMITHKPQLMKLADEILVIDHGRLVGKGTHRELMRKNKYYQLLQK
ncbi:MAG: ABC transporter ATP-binding protein, partial [Candidatus Saccharibacteria bacterium]|nr:ABC transporter ATP-binding protein [Candidatus Saccharibacteria bacterium]